MRYWFGSLLNAVRGHIVLNLNVVLVSGKRLSSVSFAIKTHVLISVLKQAFLGTLTIYLKKHPPFHRYSSSELYRIVFRILVTVYLYKIHQQWDCTFHENILYISYVRTRTYFINVLLLYQKKTLQCN